MDKSIHIQKRLTLSSKNKEAIIEGISFAFIFLFVYTAYDKGTDVSGFSKTLGRYNIIRAYTDQIAWMIPAVEIPVSGLLLIPKTRKLGLIGALSLMLTFTLFLLYIVATSESLFCSCGGLISSMGFWEHIWFNTFFIVLAIIGLLLLRSMKETSIRTEDSK